MSPYATLHVLLVAPALLQAVLWSGFAVGQRGIPRALLAGAAALTFLHHGLELSDVLQGHPAWEAGPLREHLKWFLLGALLLVWNRGERPTPPHALSMGLALVHFALGAWLPAVVGMGRATPRPIRPMFAALFFHAAAVACRLYYPLEVTAQLGFLGLSMDGTTVAGAWLLGGGELLGWAAVLIVAGLCGAPSSPAASPAGPPLPARG